MDRQRPSFMRGKVSPYNTRACQKMLSLNADPNSPHPFLMQKPVVLQAIPQILSVAKHKYVYRQKEGAPSVRTWGVNNGDIGEQLRVAPGFRHRG